ncbi:hypothetical protein HR12_20905 [Microbacterium sp. SUBG005]|nr:hypothetical protein HR12_20905 [Microbacterium sp. SUBG005]
MDIGTSDNPAGWPAGSDVNQILNFFGTIGSTINKSPSWIYYMGYIEDLTVSGLTYSQAHARALAWHNAEVINLGGLYRGDQWTDPAVMP